MLHSQPQWVLRVQLKEGANTDPRALQKYEASLTIIYLAIQPFINHPYDIIKSQLQNHIINKLMLLLLLPVSLFVYEISCPPCPHVLSSSPISFLGPFSLHLIRCYSIYYQYHYPIITTITITTIIIIILLLSTYFFYMKYIFYRQIIQQSTNVIFFINCRL